MIAITKSAMMKVYKNVSGMNYCQHQLNDNYLYTGNIIYKYMITKLVYNIVDVLL